MRGSELDEGWLVYSCPRCGRRVETLTEELEAPTEQGPGSYNVTIRQTESALVTTDDPTKIEFGCPRCGEPMQKTGVNNFGPVMTVELRCPVCGLECKGVAEVAPPDC